MEVLEQSIGKKTEERARKLDKAMLVAEKFHREYHDVIRALKDIQDNLLSQDSPGVDVPTIKEQQKELKVRFEGIKQIPPKAIANSCFNYYSLNVVVD